MAFYSLKYPLYIIRMILLTDSSGPCIMQLERKYINCARLPDNQSKLKNLCKNLQIVI